MAVLADVTNLFDPYSRQARLYPALLVILPIFVVLGACFPALITSPSVASLAAVCVACGILYWLSNFVRSLGKTIEPKLLRVWGGWPSTEMLRWSGPVDRHTLERYHAFLQAKLPNLPFPDAAYEQSHPAEADRVYASAVHWLKEQCRGVDYPLVEKENAQYGFRRNVLGAKSIAIGISFACLCFGLEYLAYVATGYHGTAANIMLMTIGYMTKTAVIDASLIFILTISLWWIFGANAGWVRQAGRDYASALLATCDKQP